MFVPNDEELKLKEIVIILITLESICIIILHVSNIVYVYYYKVIEVIIFIINIKKIL